MKAADYLVQEFKIERYAYLGLSAAAAILVVVLAGWMAFVLKEQSAVLPMFGSAGVIAASQGRMLHIWTTITKLLVKGEVS